MISLSVCHQPASYTACFVHQLSQLADRLKLHDPQYKHTAEEYIQEPQWLHAIRAVDAHFSSGQLVHATPPPPASSIGGGGGDTRASSEVAEITQGVTALTQQLQDMHVSTPAHAQTGQQLQGIKGLTTDPSICLLIAFI